MNKKRMKKIQSKNEGNKKAWQWPKTAYLWKFRKKTGCYILSLPESLDQG